MNLKGLKVVVAGISKSGLSTALFLKDMGACVYATDNGSGEALMRNVDILKSKDIDLEIGEHTEGFVKRGDLLIVSPGVDENSPVIRWAHEAGMPIISELELAYLFCKGKILAVTGTNGKTTTTSLLGKIIRDSGRPAVICGNIGNPFIGEIDRISGEHWVVLEVSSFQLEWIDTFRPYVSIILNVTNDHLDRHKSFEEYKRAKTKIFSNQQKDDYLILNHEDEALRDLESRPRRFFFSRTSSVEGIFIDGNEIIFNSEGRQELICTTDIIKLAGIHNLDNVMASVLAAKLIGIDNESISRSISAFEVPKHRFQSFMDIEGVEFINDSKATNVDSTIKALTSLSKPVILIAGGRDKDIDFSLATESIRQRVKKLILIGEAADRIESIFKDLVPIQRAETIEDAVLCAYRSSARGDAVMLSPMCASFDMFQDYAQRGELFMKAAEELRTKACVR
jgi:UDP-N-acetylmuramoylalanine--D-glutamate ligase